MPVWTGRHHQSLDLARSSGTWRSRHSRPAESSRLSARFHLPHLESLEVRWLLSGQPPVPAVDNYEVIAGSNLVVEVAPADPLSPGKVRWEVSSGGNGHVYERVHQTGNWFDAARGANQRSFGGTDGHLATITSAAEQAFLVSRLGLGDLQAWIGGYQDVGADDFVEFDRGWRWVTEEPWNYTLWGPGALGAPGETYLEIAGNWDHAWNDLPGFVDLTAYWVEYPLDAPTRNQELIPLGASWKYFDQGADLGTAWRFPGFGDQSWKSGPAELGYGDGDERTIVEYGADEFRKHMTTYFRREFNATDVDSLTGLELLVKRDDGVAVYLNGTEILRNGLGENPHFRSPATVTVDEENEYFLFRVDENLLVNGVNVIAVEVHQVGANSNDLSFDLQLTAQRRLPRPLLANDVDPERDALSAVLVSAPSNGTVNLSTTGAFEYVPNAGFIGLDQFTYRASDGTSLSPATTVNIQVNPGNAPPIAANDSYVSLSGQALQVAAPEGLLANDFDPEGVSLQVEGITLPSHGTLSLNGDGSFTYVPALQFIGDDSFQYRAIDGRHGSPVTTVHLTVGQIPGIPVARDDQFVVVEDRALIVDNSLRQTMVTATTPGGAPRWLAYDAVGDMLYATVPSNNTVVPINPYTGETERPIVIPGGADEIVVTDDGKYLYIGTDGSQSVTRVRLDTRTIDRTFPLLYGAASDLHIIPGSPESFAVATSIYDPTVIYDDGVARSLRAGGTNQVEVSDDGRTLYTFAHSISSYGLGEFSIESDGLHYVSNREYLVGAGGFVYVDGLLLFDSGQIVDPVGFKLKGSLSRPFNAEVVALPGTNRLAYVTDVNDTIQVFDVATQQQVAGIRVPGRPTARRGISMGVDGIAFVAIGTSNVHLVRSDLIPGASRYDLLANDSDPENDPLTTLLVAGPQHGTLTLNADGTFEYRPDPNFHGHDTFTYRVSDGRLASNLATVTLDVRSVNDIPSSVADRYLLSRRDQPLAATIAGGVLSNDVDPEGDPLTARMVGLPSHGSVNLRPDGSFTYTPGPSFALTDSFQYRANDGKSDSPITTVTIELDVPRITVGDIELRANTPNQQVPIFVHSNTRVSGVNLFVQVGDGGPELSQFGAPAGTDGPSIEAVDLKTGTIFAAVSDPQVNQPGIPQVATAAIAISNENEAVLAEGKLVTITVDTTGFFSGTWDLKLTDVLPYSELNGPFDTDFAGAPAIIQSGRLIVREAQVVNRQLVYRNSSHGTLAIAIDKQPLLPGETAAFTHYSSYSRGINGLLIDVQGFLRDPVLGDFQFRMGRSNNIAAWGAAPPPSRLEVVATAESDVRRVVLEWDDEAIFNQWLEVVIPPSPETGVVSADRFYFGNAPGDTGDSTTNALVNATDIVYTRDNKRGPFNPAPITDRYDFNRDGLVNATDVVFVRDHVTSPFNALPLITPPASETAALASIPRAALPVQSGPAVPNRLAIRAPRAALTSATGLVMGASDPPTTNIPVVANVPFRSGLASGERLRSTFARRSINMEVTDAALSGMQRDDFYAAATRKSHQLERTYDASL